MVKIDSKKVISLHYAKSVTHSDEWNELFGQNTNPRGRFLCCWGRSQYVFAYKKGPIYIGRKDDDELSEKALTTFYVSLFFSNSLSFNLVKRADIADINQSTLAIKRIVPLQLFSMFLWLSPSLYHHSFCQQSVRWFLEVTKDENKWYFCYRAFFAV